MKVHDLVKRLHKLESLEYKTERRIDGLKRNLVEIKQAIATQKTLITLREAEHELRREAQTA